MANSSFSSTRVTAESSITDVSATSKEFVYQLPSSSAMDPASYSRLDEKEKVIKVETSRQAKDRKVSTGTLNRLILVAQALESEVDGRRQTEISGGKITFSLRMANMILLVLINALVFTGFGKYQAPGDGGYKEFLLTADKWTYNNEATVDLPSTFATMQLNGQYLAAAITIFLLMSTICLQLVHICRKPSSRITVGFIVQSMFYSFGAVPFSLFVFGLEMHYSTCPWVDDWFLQNAAADMSAQCAINGWALAGIFSLLSCGLFVAEGLITAFFRTEQIDRHSKDAVL